jgi:hypothetical protein
MNKQEFNEAMTKLKYPEALGYLKDQKERDAWLKGHIAVNDYYNDLNLLMPLAWKHDSWICVYEGEVNYDNHLQAIRDCLWSLKAILCIMSYIY